jgi:hypothetical protein
MRGDDQPQAAMAELYLPRSARASDHPLRAIRAMVEAVLEGLSPQLDRLNSAWGGPR